MKGTVSAIYKNIKSFLPLLQLEFMLFHGTMKIKKKVWGLYFIFLLMEVKGLIPFTSLLIL